jgi:hypothetical protein
VGRIALLILLLAPLITATGCFKPDHPACAFSCATPPHTCPTGFVCGADNLCHDPTSTGICAISTDASASDADGGSGTPDAAAAESGPETGGVADTRTDATDGRGDATGG